MSYTGAKSVNTKLLCVFRKCFTKKPPDLQAALFVQMILLSQSVLVDDLVSVFVGNGENCVLVVGLGVPVAGCDLH